MSVLTPPPSKPSRHFTPFLSAAEELAMKRDEDAWNNEGGHLNSSSEMVVSTPSSDLPYKAIVGHQGRIDSEHAFLTVREAEASTGRNAPVPPARRTLYDIDALWSPLKGHGG
jgi:hypothetical protein